MMRLRPGTIGLALLCATAVSATAQQPKVVEHWKVGGHGGWDYMLSDDSAHRLYIAHNSRVEVIDTTTGKALGAVTGFKSTHGIALDPNGRVGYISDGAGNAIGVFDREKLTVIKTVPAGTNPDGIAYEPTTKTVWAFNGKSKNVTVLDTATDEVVATISLPGKPEFPQTDGHGSVFVNIEDQNAIVKLDASTRKVVATWPLKGCESPSGMAIDRGRHRVFSVCDGNKMAIVDYATGKLLGLANIGDSPDAAGFDTKHALAFSSNGGDGTLSVVDTTRPDFPTVATLPTAKGARTMAFDALSNRIYLATAEFGMAPAPTTAMPHPRPIVMPDTFEVMVVKP
ncbi:MAG: YncE family protein [Edaphobacter sp.]|uniref:YncE family protein n=1 Tax=Edaphobacter sp. TaxID=1934404 RepID=UPI00238213D8|nr:YncE family protein [Edaphobacter sp.]MDE1178002.1 YncE family protein [Edaphobacter sp.]